MENVFITRKNGDRLSASDGQSHLSLLVHCAGFEIMTQHITPESMVWLAPAEDKSTVEFFFVQSGMLSLCTDDGLETLYPGDSFYVDGLRRDLRIFAPCDTDLLYVTNRPMFDSLIGYQADLDGLLQQISRKDQTVYRHSRSVLRLLTRLFGQLSVPPEELTFDDLAAAALFHDLGKCMVPDEILRRSGPLSDGEFALMKRHSDFGAAILKDRFNENVVRCVRAHHERLDGSGYPDGLSGGDIPLGARLIAVAEAFDVMTSPREYRPVYTPLEAARELVSLPQQYDPTITAALLRLVESGDPCTLPEQKTE